MNHKKSQVFFQKSVELGIFYESDGEWRVDMEFLDILVETNHNLGHRGGITMMEAAIMDYLRRKGRRLSTRQVKRIARDFLEDLNPILT